MNLQKLKVCVARRAREWDDVADIFQSGEIHHDALQSEAEAGVRDGAESSQIEIPPVGFFIETAGAETLQEHVISFFALAAADDLTDSGNQHIHGARGSVVFVDAHVKGFDIFGVVGDDHRLLENFFGKKALVLGL